MGVMRKSFISTTVVVLSLGVPGAMPTSRADEATTADWDDSSTFLDIASVSHGHGKRADGSWRFQHTITTQEKWRSKRLCASGITVAVKDTNRSVQIYWEGKLRAKLRDGEREGRQIIGHPAVWRSDHRSVRVSIRPKLLGEVNGDYRYAVSTSYVSCQCSKTGGLCPTMSDRVPERGYIRHDQT
jgi:hypothetical protein